GRLREAGVFEWDLIRYRMQTTSRNPDIPRHGSVHPVSKTFSCRVKIVSALPGHGIVWVDNGRRFTDDAIPFFPSGDPVSQCHNFSAEFMTQYHRVIDRPTVVRGPLMQITPADPYIGHF